MSVLEPHSTVRFVAKIGIDPPDFPVVVRGYDRQRVNAYLQDMVARLAAEQDRAAQAEQVAVNKQPPTFEHLGAEAIKVLELANASAELLVAQAKRRGETIVEEAEGQASDLFEEAKQRAERLHAAARGTLSEAADERDRILADASEEGTQIRTLAEDDARAMLEEARAESEHTWQKVRGECAAMLAETERLQTLRDRTMEHLSRVQTEVNSLLAGPSEDEPEVPDAPSVLDVAGGDDDDAAALEATAETGPESAEAAETAEPDMASAVAVQTESDQAADSKPGQPAKAAARDRHQAARSG
jgi:cell division septum initiation protein DivIVA